MSNIPSGSVTKVAIIIVTYNCPEFVEICLDSVRHYSTIPYEIIVVDNASEQPLVDYLKQQENLKLIINKENKLWCAACNQGIQAVGDDVTHILLLNSDMEVRRADWLQRMVNVMESSDHIGLVGTAAARVRFWPTFGGVDGQCLMIKRSLIRELGLLDCQRYPWTSGDIDYAARAFKKGYLYKIMPRQPELAVHYRGMSWRSQSAKPTQPQDKPLPDLQKLHQEVNIREIIRSAGLRPIAMPRLLWQLYKRLPGKPFYELNRRERKLAQGKGPAKRKYYGHKTV